MKPACMCIGLFRDHLASVYRGSPAATPRSTIVLRVFIIVLALATHQVHAIDVIAHRGYACVEAENSIQSIRNAWLAGADAVEIDVRVSSDGIAYLFHDDELSNKGVAGLAYSEIERLGDRPIPTLSEALNATDGKGYYVLDLKTNALTDVDQILRVVRQSRVPAQSVSFQSASLDSLVHIGRRMPGAKLTFLSHLKWTIPYVLSPNAKQLVNALDDLDIDRVSIKGRSFIDKRFIDTIKATGREVHVWTINAPKRAAHYRRLGVDGIITDRVEGIFGGNDKEPCRTTVTDAN